MEMTKDQLTAELYLINLLERIQTELRHCRVFVSTPERIHPIGLEDYDALKAEVDDLIAAYKSGKTGLHILTYLQAGEP